MEDKKLCYKCKKDKPLSEFHKNKTKSDGVHSCCKQCQREYTRKHYEHNKQYYVDKARAYRNSLLEKVFEYLSDHPCVDCGEGDLVVLEFDHIDGSKEGNVLNLLRCSSWDSVEQEISKCEVRCANCHRRRHAVEQKSLKWLWENNRRVFNESTNYDRL